MVEQPLCHRGLEPAAPQRFGGRQRLMPTIWCLILLFLANLGHPGAGLAAPGPDAALENLEYRVSLGVWSEVALVHLRLAQVGPNRYRAEFSGAAQGMWRLLNRWLPEGYETDMVLEGGRLKPLVFREEFQAKGHHIRKEYRFDYSRRVLELWRGEDYQEPVKNWQVPMQTPVYDPLSLFYNLRQGAFGPLMAGDTMKVAVVPTPEPQELVFHIGPETAEGRKIMLEVAGVGQRISDVRPLFYFLPTPSGCRKRPGSGCRSSGSWRGSCSTPKQSCQRACSTLRRHRPRKLP